MSGAIRQLIFWGCILAGLSLGLGAARAEPEAPAPEEPAPVAEEAPTDDYAGRAHAALQEGRTLEAGQILLAGYKKTGDLWALRMAGTTFRRAGQPELALAAWGHFLCTSPDPKARLDVRLQIRDQLKKAPRPCKGPRPRDIALDLEPTPPARPKSTKRVHKRLDRDRGESKGLDLNFEIETGMRVGESTFGFAWSPGFWTHRKGKAGFGLFMPIFMGEGPGMNASIGIEPRAHYRLRDGVHAELALGAHSHDGDSDSSLSISGGLNFNDILSLRVRNEKYDGGSQRDEMEYSASTVELMFTGKTGKTITGVGAGISLLVLLLAVVAA